MLDVVCLAMAGVLALLGLSVFLAKRRALYARHKQVQLVLAVALLIVIGLFEAEMRLSGWRHRAEASPYYTTWVFPVLTVHLVFAVSTAMLWVAVIVAALRKFPRPPRPGSHSATHRWWAWLAAVDMVLTTLTGWLFYWLAFAA